MEKEFDFKNIGKRMPYRTPDGFFGKMQKQPVAEELPSHSLIVSTDLDSSYSDTLDRYIESMSDEELAEWVELSENDIFIN